MNHEVLEQTLGKVTKIILTPIGPLQYLLNSPGVTHVRCLEQSLKVLRADGKENIADLFFAYRPWISKGLFWADRGWKNVCHYYQNPDKPGVLRWPGAAAECQYYFNKALHALEKDVTKGMFYFGAALHLVQDMCVPHHAVGSVFDGHQEFEKWVENNWHQFSCTPSGKYLPFTHPSQWIDYNANTSASYYSQVSLFHKCSESSYEQAARDLLPLTIQTSAGFLVFFKQILESDNFGYLNF
ncbi:hypothetical protein JCM15765_45050 [Paradesulfitobacterium aromaticivorans]